MGKKDGKKKGDGAKKEEVPIIVVLKLETSCECQGCPKKVKQSVERFDGVEDVKVDSSTQLTVKGKFDPEKLRESVASKTKKKLKVVHVSPLPKKDEEGGGENMIEEDKEKNESEEPVVVLNVPLCCESFIQEIRRIILKTKGVKDVATDAQKDLVTVKGTMDVKDLTAYVEGKLKRSIKIVPHNEDGIGGGEKKVGCDGGDEGKKEKPGKAVSRTKCRKNSNDVISHCTFRSSMPSGVFFSQQD